MSYYITNDGTIKYILENLRNDKHRFCRKAILLVAPSEDFAATELGLLEDTFITLAREAGRTTIANATGAPRWTCARTPEEPN